MHTMLTPDPRLVTALAGLTAEDRRWLAALSHLDHRTIRRCATGRPVRSSCLARLTEALNTLRERAPARGDGLTPPAA